MPCSLTFQVSMAQSSRSYSTSNLLQDLEEQRQLSQHRAIIESSFSDLRISSKPVVSLGLAQRGLRALHLGGCSADISSKGLQVGSIPGMVEESSHLLIPALNARLMQHILSKQTQYHMDVSIRRHKCYLVYPAGSLQG